MSQAKTFLTHGDVSALADSLRRRIVTRFAGYPHAVAVYGVPRGGTYVAYLLQSVAIVVANSAEEADVIVDDIVDSGATRDRYHALYPNKQFLALVDKTNGTDEYRGHWVVFPWEVSEAQKDEGIEDNIRRLLQYVGEDATRGGLLETPSRVAKAWGEWCAGYSLKAEDILKVFEDGAEDCDEMVVRKGIPIYSHCEHHLAAIIGECTIAYIPDGKIVGLSKMDRLADMFARRLQVQERMGNQIADAMFDILKPKGVAVWISARHLCIESRGVKNHNSLTETCALRGVFKTQPETRAEFLSLVK